MWWVCPHTVWPGSTALSQDERARAAVMTRRADAEAFRRCRGALRSILAARTRLPEAALEFAYGPTGRPRLAGHPDLHFSVSHTDDWAVVAVSLGSRIGVDVERYHHPGVDTAALTRRFLLPAAETPPAGEAGFAHAWTRYEARIKAAAGSLGRPLPAAAAGWPAFSLDAPPGHSATLVSAGPASLAPPRVVRAWHACSQHRCRTAPDGTSVTVPGRCRS